MKVTNNINLTCEDNMELMARYPDNYFELAIVDPPYGINVGNMNMGVGKGKRCPKLKNRKWIKKDWDKQAPNDVYFNELFRVSKNQIIWGGNYFNLPISQYFAIIDKGQGMYNRSFAECEYAWVRKGGTRILKINPVQKDRIHPTQKPCKLYEWLLMNYAKEGDKILDTHLGSMSIAIACHNLGFELTGCELDKEYYDQGIKRVKNHIAQQRLF
jgi:site-specific DNA-methyltransferase (adenine-specific)